MPVVPYQANLFQDRKDFYQLLSAFKQLSIEKSRPQIVSISTEIDPVDPLAVLQTIAQPNELHFYLEQENQGEAIAAIGSVTQKEIEGHQRFSIAQEFANSCLQDVVTINPSKLPFTGPHFFCNFTFFDKKSIATSPFSAATVFLPKWQISRRGDRSTVVVNLVVDSKLSPKLAEKVWQQLQQIRLAKYSVLNIFGDIRDKFRRRDAIAAESFKAAVTSALKQIRLGRLDKIVLAHAIDVTSPLPFQLVPSLNHLRKLYPDCYVFSTSNGKGQNFIGASPERLVSISDRRLTTDALAGTAPRGKTVVEDANLANCLLTSEKERHEHQLVVNFITQRLIRLGLSPQLALAPTLLQLSNIQHLHTPIQATISAHLHPLEVVAELHPTPAVAGVPRDIACQQIRRYETFERSLYAAPLGWIDYQGNAEFIVGIRSALIDGCHARLYAGAGIVAGSDPDKELTEIQLKLQALLRALV